MRESTVETYLHAQVVKAGGWTDKFSSPGRRNVPDRLVTWPDTDAHYLMIHFVEIKSPGKTARPAQVRDHARRGKMCCKVFVLDTKAKVDKYVSENS